MHLVKIWRQNSHWHGNTINYTNLNESWGTLIRERNRESKIISFLKLQAMTVSRSDMAWSHTSLSKHKSFRSSVMLSGYHIISTRIICLGFALRYYFIYEFYLLYHCNSQTRTQSGFPTRKLSHRTPYQDHQSLDSMIRSKLNTCV